MKKGNINNSLVKHNLETNHDSNFKDSKMLIYIDNKKHQKIVESRIISNHNTIKQRPSSFNLSSNLTRFVFKSYKIPSLK